MKIIKNAFIIVCFSMVSQVVFAGVKCSNSQIANASVNDASSRGCSVDIILKDGTHMVTQQNIAGTKKFECQQRLESDGSLVTIAQMGLAPEHAPHKQSSEVRISTKGNRGEIEIILGGVYRWHFNDLTCVITSDFE